MMRLAVTLALLLSPAAAQKHESGRACLDGKDNDHDHKTDCQDPDCLRDPRIAQRCEIIENAKKLPEYGAVECFDGKDNDGNGRTDCDDYSCVTDSASKYRCAHSETGRECTDGRDNDGDGHTDCDDSECKKSPLCKHKEFGKLCFDGKDNDNDGQIDCDGA